jgi:hypothetical protein
LWQISTFCCGKSLPEFPTPDVVAVVGREDGVGADCFGWGLAAGFVVFAAGAGGLAFCGFGFDACSGFCAGALVLVCCDAVVVALLCPGAFAELPGDCGAAGGWAAGAGACSAFFSWPGAFAELPGFSGLFPLSAKALPLNAAANSVNVSTLAAPTFLMCIPDSWFVLLTVVEEADAT